MNINFELYKVFYEVANQGSISKGASKLMISQPAVSQAIHTLEDELGGKVFERTPKGVVLTNEGQVLYNYIKEGMSYFVNGTNKFMLLKNADEGVLNIGSTSVISSEFLMPYLKKFNELYPNVKINIYNDLTDNLIQKLRNGSLDIIITAIPNKDIRDLVFTEMIELHDVLVGGSKYRKMTFESFDSLKNEILLQKAPSITRKNFDEYMTKNGLSVEPKMEVISHHLLTDLAENNFGVALLTKEYVKDKIGKTLFMVDFPLSIPKRKLGYAIKKSSIPSFSASKFIEVLNSVKD